MLKIYHNNHCSKSNCALDLLNQAGKPYEVVEYLHTPPTAEELKDILAKLGLKPEDIVRKSEPLFKEQFEGRSFTDEAWITILVNNPVLIERPIVVSDTEAVIGRPPEKVLKLIQAEK